MQGEVVVSNLPPTWVLWLGYLGLFLFGIATVAIAIVLIRVMGQVSQLMDEVNAIVEKDVHRDMLPNVTAITANIKTITDDAAETTTNVTGTVNRVSHVISGVATKMESPAIKAVGVLSGVLAGARALRGQKEPPAAKKRGGLFGKK